MGTTANRGLRYPEGTTPGNQMHTRIKELAEDVDSKLQFPVARYHMRSEGESIPHAAWYTLIYWTPIETSSRITYNGTSTFTILDAGLYTISFSAMFRNENTSNGIRGLMIVVNGTQVDGVYVAPVAAQGDYVSGKCGLSMRVPNNCTVQFHVIQTSGGAVTVHGTPWTNFSIARVN